MKPSYAHSGRARRPHARPPGSEDQHLGPHAFLLTASRMTEGTRQTPVLCKNPNRHQSPAPLLSESPRRSVCVSLCLQ